MMRVAELIVAPSLRCSQYCLSQILIDFPLLQELMFW
jgi:hypothetical protein